jgi:hypothetical protein
VAFLVVLATALMIGAVCAGARAGAVTFPVITGRAVGWPNASPCVLTGLAMMALALFCRSHRPRRIVPVVVLLILVMGYESLREEHPFDILSEPVPLWFVHHSGR